MTEKPIIFNTEMVQAILGERKTQTRRVIKPQPTRLEDIHDRGIKAKYQPGDILWVRETWCRFGDIIGISQDADIFYYKADYPCPVDKSIKRWRPSIYMPKEAARIFLRVKGVRVQRVQDITEEDAVAEGCLNKADYAELWDILNAKRGCGWETNPWVWVIEFERVNASGLD